MFEVRKVKGEWFVVNVPPYEADGETCWRYGGYDTKAEAEADARAMQKFAYDSAKVVLTSTSSKHVEGVLFAEVSG